jgi:P27 family predicted phage terminase small subunit
VEKPCCPAWLTGEARAEWNRLTKELVRLGVLAKADRTVLALLCQSWGDYVRAIAYVAKAEAELRAAGGHLYDADDTKTSRVRRAMRDAKAAAEMVAKLSDRFGLSPSARPRLHVNVPPPDPVPSRDRYGDGAKDKDRFFAMG